MLTDREAREKNLQDGKDYIFLGSVRYQKGESFKHRDRDVTVTKIIDPHHFIANGGESWHTGMFLDNDCTHGKNMIPLEFNSKQLRNALVRMSCKQVFNPDISVLREDGQIENLGECMIRYNKNEGLYVVETKDREEKHESPFTAVQNVFGHGGMEVIYSLQDWGESGEVPQEILIDDENCTEVRYEGIPHTVVEKALDSENPKTDTVTLLKRHCSPAQTYVLVRNLQEENGGYVGENITEEDNFLSGLEAFYDHAVFTEGGNGKKTEAEL